MLGQQENPYLKLSELFIEEMKKLIQTIQKGSEIPKEKIQQTIFQATALLISGKKVILYFDIKTKNQKPKTKPKNKKKTKTKNKMENKRQKTKNKMTSTDEHYVNRKRYKKENRDQEDKRTKAHRAKE